MPNLARIAKLATLLAAAAVGACVTKSAPPTLSLDARNCSTQPELGRAQALILDAEKAASVDIDADTACLQAADGAKSAYVVFQLPESAEPYVVDVASVPVGQTVFAPRLIVLDAQGSVVRERSGDSFQYRGPSLHTGIRVHPGERYVIVASDSRLVGKQISRLVGGTITSTAPVGTGFLMIRTGHETTDFLTYAHNGSVTASARSLPKVN